MARHSAGSRHRSLRLAVSAVAGLTIILLGIVVTHEGSGYAAPTTASANLLRNGGFESSSDTPTAFSSWSVVSRVKSSSAQSGGYYSRVSSNSSTMHPIGIVARPSVTISSAGTHLYATCQVRSNDPYPQYSAILRLTEVTTAGKHIVTERPWRVLDDWVGLSVYYTTSQPGSQIYLALYGGGMTSTNKGALGVDGCTLQTTTVVQPTPQPPTMPTSVPSGYHRAFTEDFNKPASLGSFDSVYKSQFAEYEGCCNTNKATRYSSAKVLSAKNGSLYYYMHSEGTTSYTAAPVPGNYLNFKYGQVGLSMRLVSSINDGYKTAFLLWPAADEWTNEVDFPEQYPDFAQNIYAASLQTTTATGAHNFLGGPGSPSSSTLADGKYHTFLLTWVPGKITTSIDGKAVQTFTGSAVPTQAMHYVMQAEGWANHGAVPTDASATLEVPWIYINTYGS